MASSCQAGTAKNVVPALQELMDEMLAFPVHKARIDGVSSGDCIGVFVRFALAGCFPATAWRRG
jgi:hypothetical protein